MEKPNLFRRGWEAIKNRGMVFASTKFLVNKVLNQSHILPLGETPTHVVEVGAGSGGFTKGLLPFMEQNKKMSLTIVELEEKYRKRLEAITKKFKDRVTIIIGSVTDLPELITQKADVIVSALPFGSLSQKLRVTALDNMYDVLNQGGEYLQFQYLRSKLSEFRKKFGQKGSVGWTPLNLPPAFVYKFVKTEA
jgi:phospholipid N-methyltransferase